MTGGPDTPRSTPRSPCVDICRLDRHGRLCVGCFRTLEEIGRWSVAGDDEKRDILARAARRKAESAA